MEDNREVWPPAPTSSQAAEGKIRPQRPQTLSKIAVLTGLIAGLVGYGVVWRIAYLSCYPPKTSGLVALAQLPLGLEAPLLPQFLTGLSVGLVLLLLLSVLLYRRLRGFGKGLAVSLVPCLLTFLFILWLYTHMPKLP